MAHCRRSRVLFIRASPQNPGAAAWRRRRRSGGGRNTNGLYVGRNAPAQLGASILISGNTASRQPSKGNRLYLHMLIWQRARKWLGPSAIFQQFTPGTRQPNQLPDIVAAPSVGGTMARSEHGQGTTVKVIGGQDASPSDVGWIKPKLRPMGRRRRIHRERLGPRRRPELRTVITGNTDRVNATIDRRESRVNFRRQYRFQHGGRVVHVTIHEIQSLPMSPSSLFRHHRRRPKSSANVESLDSEFVHSQYLRLDRWNAHIVAPLGPRWELSRRNAGLVFPNLVGLLPTPPLRHAHRVRQLADAQSDISTLSRRCTGVEVNKCQQLAQPYVLPTPHPARQGAGERNVAKTREPRPLVSGMLDYAGGKKPADAWSVIASSKNGEWGKSVYAEREYPAPVVQAAVDVAGRWRLYIKDAAAPPALPGPEFRPPAQRRAKRAVNCFQTHGAPEIRSTVRGAQGPVSLTARVSGRFGTPDMRKSRAVIAQQAASVPANAQRRQLNSASVSPGIPARAIISVSPVRRVRLPIKRIDAQGRYGSASSHQRRQRQPRRHGPAVIKQRGSDIVELVMAERTAQQARPDSARAHNRRVAPFPARATAGSFLSAKGLPLQTARVRPAPPSGQAQNMLQPPRRARQSGSARRVGSGRP
ncbi:hypothetical protein H6P81_021215 [Aristolochia fimbriata]|uniref:Uncharacterized protein n=1 Tax=Aristolochia fimbriata TaxID=158543 RepID=A0AAV7DQI1_ARIFI|nr:hypothetical protein H6P81_021215 [Aristolochia fimbriata]